MKSKLLVVTVCAVAALASGQVAYSQQAPSSAPTRAEIEQQARLQGPSTGRIGATTQQDPPAPKHADAPVDPKLLRPLSKREIGMLFNACIAYAECKSAYAKAYEHNQALLRAQKNAAAGGE